MRILLIAGHGQGDSGACGCGTQEAIVARELTERIRYYLSDYTNVEKYPTEKNCYKQNKAGNPPNWKAYDFVLEVHFNAFNDKTAHGTEILVHRDQSRNDAELVMMSAMGKLGFRLRGDRGLQRRSDLMNMNSCKRAGVHYALLETCFITNQNDMALYSTKKDAIGKAIADSFISVFDLRKPEPAQTPTPAPSSDVMKVQVGPVEGNADAIAKRLNGFVRDYKYVQVGAYREIDNAVEKVKEMLKLGYNVRIRR